ncbi:hypothetical protein B0H21DRAFT_761489, partial [Amylocystis lapponica]
RSLIACTLTCRAWLPQSRFHLLRCPLFRSSYQIARFSRLLARSNTQQLGLCVEEVFLNINHVGPSESHMLLQSFLVTFTTRLPNMRRLGIASYLFGSSLNMSHPTFFMAATLPAFHSTRFSTINDLGFFLCALTGLSVLHIRGLTLSKDRQYNPVLFQKSKARLSLISLTIELSFTAVLADLIMDVVSFPEHAVAGFTFSEHGTLYLREKLGPSLNSLGSDLTLRPFYFSQVPRTLDVIKSSSLRWFTLEFDEWEAFLAVA